MRKTLSLLFAIFLLIGSMLMAVQAEEIAAGTCGEDLVWVLSEDGTLTISGEGEMYDGRFYGDYAEFLDFFSYRNDIIEIILDDRITRISNYAFTGIGFPSMGLPKNVEEIGNYAFHGCGRVSNLFIPASVKYIGEYALPGADIIDLDPNNQEFVLDERGVLFSRDMTRLVQAPRTLDGVYEIASEVTSIDDKAFSGCEIYVLLVPSSITEFSGSPNKADQIVFCGDAPHFKKSWIYRLANMRQPCLEGFNGFVYYPADNATWTEDVMTSAGGDATWIAYEEGEEPWLENPFTDVSDTEYYHAPVLWAMRKGITSGTSATTFSPDDFCSRGQVVTFLWRAVGCPEPTLTENPFTDVNESAYYYNAVLWAVEHGITAGTGNGQFSPNKTCTRDQVATFLWRAMGQPEPEQRDNPFVDVQEDIYYYIPVLWAVENGITAGTGDGTTFSPNADCTRAQIVTFLYRTLAK